MAREIKVGKYSRSFATRNRAANAVEKLGNELGADLHFILTTREDDGRFVPAITNAVCLGVTYIANDNWLIVG
jgi:hypothetical protein